MTSAVAPTEARCDCCDLPVSSCGREAEQRQRAEAQATRRQLLNSPDYWPARFPGVCSSCGERFAEGDPISRTDDDGYAGGLCCDGTRA